MAETIDSFERRFSAAALKGINAETWDLFIRTINARLKGVEEKKASFEATEQLLVSIGLQRINEALLPAFQTITGLAHLGAIFTATSTTTLEVGVGQKQLTIAQEYRERFAPSAYLAIRADGQTSPVMTGSLVDYHRESGTLTINVDYADGEGSHASWVISPTASPDYDGVELVRGNAPPDLDTLEKIAVAIGNDPEFASTVGEALSSLGESLAGKASTDHNHDTRYYTQSQVDNALAAFAPRRVGEFFWYFGEDPPPYALVCDGSTISRATYADLWAFAQASGNLAASEGVKEEGQFGPGNGTTTFTLPDLTTGAEFIRAVTSGRDIGTWQNGDLQSHNHTLPEKVMLAQQSSSGFNSGVSGGGAYSRIGMVSDSTPGEPNVGSTGGTETRPRNIALLPCIVF